MDSENFQKDITEADLPNSPRHHPCYRKGENPQQSRKLNHTLWSTIDIPTTLEPHPFSKPPRTSISGKRRKPLISSHWLHFSSFPPANSPPHFFVPDFLCILALHLAASGGTSVHTIAVAHLPPPLPSSSPLVFEDSTAPTSKSHGFYANQPRESSQF